MSHLFLTPPRKAHVHYLYSNFLSWLWIWDFCVSCSFLTASARNQEVWSPNFYDNMVCKISFSKQLWWETALLKSDEKLWYLHGFHGSIRSEVKGSVAIVSVATVSFFACFWGGILVWRINLQKWFSSMKLKLQTGKGSQNSLQLKITESMGPHAD